MSPLSIRSSVCLAACFSVSVSVSLGLVWSGLVWSGLVGSGLVWSDRVWSGRVGSDRSAWTLYACDQLLDRDPRRVPSLRQGILTEGLCPPEQDVPGFYSLNPKTLSP